MQRKCRRFPIAIAVVFSLVFGIHWLLATRADARFVGRWQIEPSTTAAALCPWSEVELSPDGWGKVSESNLHVGRSCRWQVENNRISLRVYSSDDVCLPDCVETLVERITGCQLLSKNLTFAVDRFDDTALTLRPAPAGQGLQNLVFPTFELHRRRPDNDLRIGLNH